MKGDTKMRKLYTKRIVTGILAATLAGMIAAPTVSAEEEKPTAEASMGISSKYVWRGYELSRDSMVLFPSASVSYKGFGMNLWGALDSKVWSNVAGARETNNWLETDLTLSYDGAYEKFSYGLGWIYYGLDALEDGQDIYASLSYDMMLTPTLTVYRDISGYDVTYVTLGISYSVPLNENLNLDLGAQAGYMDDNGNTYDAWHDGLLSASISFPVNEYVTVTPEIYYSFPLSSKASDPNQVASMENFSRTGTDDDFLYGGISVSFAF